MRVFMATLSTETNTFAAMPTAMSGFEAYFLRHGDASSMPPNLMTEALHVWRKRSEDLGWEVVESIAAIAEPAGPTTAECYQALRDRLLSDAVAAGAIDIVLLQLHGAMVAEGTDDCEGDIISRVRAMLPDAVIGVCLDPHCHLTQKMIECSDVIICFKEYPHDDASARAEELFDLVRKTAERHIAPVMATYDCRMINLYLTKSGAMRAFVDRLSALEGEAGILSVSLAHGFPWGDVKDVGARTLVIADNDLEQAQTTAEMLGKEFFDLRQQVICRPVSLDQALDDAVAAETGPVVLADMGDNSGGGAPGDSTFVLRAVLERGLTDVATGIYWDPMVVRMCEDAGEGSELSLRIGGKTGPDSGDPVDLNAKVVRIRTGLGQHLGQGLEPLGTLVRLAAEGNVDILVNDLRTQVYHPEAFEQIGIGLHTKRLVTVKSLFHFFAPFQAIASRIIQVATPGGTSPSFEKIPFAKLQTPYWPRVDDPFTD
ncbi:MAG: M81 family metallopeptidase [Pseudomonadota bacterium]